MSKILKKRKNDKKSFLSRSESHQSACGEGHEASVRLLQGSPHSKEESWSQLVTMPTDSSDDDQSKLSSDPSLTATETGEDVKETKFEEAVGVQLERKLKELQSEVAHVATVQNKFNEKDMSSDLTEHTAKADNEQSSQTPTTGRKYSEDKKSIVSETKSSRNCEGVDKTENNDCSPVKEQKEPISHAALKNVDEKVSSHSTMADCKQSDTESVYCDCKSEVSLDSLPSPPGNASKTDLLTTTKEEDKTSDDKVTADATAEGQYSKSPSGSSIVTCAQSTQSTMTDFCRICHCEGDAELGPLIAPCYCRGSLRYVHQACLQQWIKSSDSKHCELCGYHFLMDSKLKPFHKWKKLSMSTTERRKIMCSVMFHIIAITCVIWSLQVLIERTAGEIKTGKLEWPFWTKLVVVAIGFTGGLVFMYIQCKVYVQLWRRLKAFNRVIYVRNNSPVENTPIGETVLDVCSFGSAENPSSATSSGQSNHNTEDVVTVDMNCHGN